MSKTYTEIFQNLTEEQIDTVWSACAEAGVIPQMSEEHLENDTPKADALADLLGDVDHADVIVACASIDDHTILEALTQKAVTRADHLEKQRIKQSTKHIRPNGSSSDPLEPKEPKEPRAPRDNNDNRIIATVKDNPKRPSSKAYARYAHYKVGMTVKEFVELAGPEGLADIKYDSTKGFITLVSPEEWSAQQG